MNLRDFEDQEDEASPLEQRELQEIYEEFRKRADAPACLREYLYRKIGRTLP